MSYCVLAALVLSAVQSGHADMFGYRSPGEEAIIGGQETDIREVPYQLALLRNWKEEFICGAAIVGPRDVVTAAHCVYRVNAAHLHFRAGSTFRRSGGTLHSATDLEVHPNYSFPHNDIAYLRVQPPFEFSESVTKINISDEEPLPGAQGVVCGWGVLSENSTVAAARLMRLSVTVQDRQQCSAAYGALVITPEVLCAGRAAPGRGSCSGDSGGALVVGGSMAGLVSLRSSEGCEAPGRPAGFTNIALLKPWVLDRMRRTVAQSGRSSASLHLITLHILFTMSCLTLTIQHVY